MYLYVAHVGYVTLKIEFKIIILSYFLLFFQLVEVADLQKVIEHIALTANKKKYGEFPLLLQKWRTPKDIIYILRISYQATIALQKRDLTLSDTYGIWLEMKLHLKKIIEVKATNVGLDVMMLEKLESRYNDIFYHPAMKAAIFLDPRYRQSLTQNQDDIIAAKEFKHNNG